MLRKDDALADLTVAHVTAATQPSYSAVQSLSIALSSLSRVQGERTTPTALNRLAAHAQYCCLSMTVRQLFRERRCEMCPICTKRLIANPDFRPIWWLTNLRHLLVHCPQGHGTWFSDDLLTTISIMLADQGHGMDSD